MEPLVSVEDAADLPGAPFSQPVLNIASDRIRGECGWHIAPVVIEEVTTRAIGRRLFLRTMALGEVISVIDHDGRSLTVDDFDPSTGMVVLTSAPTKTVRVVFAHGFEACPPALLGMVASAAQEVRAGRFRRLTAGPLSIERSATPESLAADTSVLGRYRLGARP